MSQKYIFFENILMRARKVKKWREAGSVQFPPWHTKMTSNLQQIRVTAPKKEEKTENGELPRYEASGFSF